MLYVTTRDRSDAFTAYRTLANDTAADGGLFTPYKLTVLDTDAILAMQDQSFSETVAQILNIFFSGKLTAWDVDFCIGKNPLKTAAVGRKIVVAELWRNPSSDYAHFVKTLYSRLYSEQRAMPSNWFKITVKIAVIFATYAELIRSGALESGKLDLAVLLGDMTDPLAAYYAKKMGLPIGNIVMCCDDNSGIWDLLNRGEIGTALLDRERRLGLERLICEICGIEEALKYKTAAEKSGLYILPEELTQIFGEGLYAAVIGNNRIDSVINSVYKNNNYVMDPRTAVCFAGLQDHRAKVGESKLTLMFSEQSPAVFPTEIQRATGLTQEFVSALQKKG